MPKQPSKGLARPKKSTKSKQKRNTQKVPRKVITLADLPRAIRDVHRTPPSRIPATRFGGPRRNHHNSARLRLLQSEQFSDAFDHVFRVEGSLERAFCYHADLDPLVEAFFPQPFDINFEGLGGLHTCTPDFIVFPFDAPAYLVDVKDHSTLMSPKLLPLYRKRQEVLKEAANIELQFSTERELSRQPELENLQIMYRHLTCPKHVLESALNQVINAVETLGGSCALAELTELSTATICHGVSYGIFCGCLTTDHNAPWGGDLFISKQEA